MRSVRKLNEAISENINYNFKNDDLLLEALTHPSLRGSKENRKQSKTNQRLEFLGDSILNMVVSVMLFKIFPDEEEGALAKRKRALICGPTIADVATKIKLGDFLLMIKSERSSGGTRNPKNLEDGLEALVGAIYLDGGFKDVETFVERHWRQLAESMLDLDPPQDFRSSLQEWAQKKGLPLPQYKVTRQSGLQHNPVFTVSLSVKNFSPVKARASTVKGAEQEAAKLMLDEIKSKGLQV